MKRSRMGGDHGYLIPSPATATETQGDYEMKLKLVATAAIMIARCEQDLSPGARTEPAIRLTGLEIARMDLLSAFSGPVESLSRAAGLQETWALYRFAQTWQAPDPSMGK